MPASVFDRLARRPVHRVQTRLAERLGNGFTGRLTARIRQRLRGCGEEREKCVKKPKQWLNVFATTNRVWQFLSALMLYGIYVHFLINDSSEGLVEQKRREAVEALGPVMLMYHGNVLLVNCLLRKSKSKKTRGWRFISVGTIVGDLLMMRLSLAKMNVLSAAGVLAACEPAEKSSVFKSMLKNGTAFAYNRFGWGQAAEQEEFDLHCCLPKIVYILCGIAIFSYTFSILFTGLQLQRHWPENAPPPLLPLHADQPLPGTSPQVQLVFVPRPSFTAPRPSEAVEPIPEPVQTHNFRATRQSMSTTRSTSEDLPRYTNQADEPYDMPPRSSMETTSSFNPDLYLVSDGFRPAPELPTYSSRPPSMRGRPPSYSSRPSSIRNV